MPDIVDSAIRWGKAREAVLECSVFDDDYRRKLKALAEAEDTLYKLVYRRSYKYRSEAMMELIMDNLADKVMTAGELAKAAGVNTRTIYRYIEVLRDLGVMIKGEPGYGYTIVKKKVKNGL